LAIGSGPAVTAAGAVVTAGWAKLWTRGIGRSAAVSLPARGLSWSGFEEVPCAGVAAVARFASGGAEPAEAWLSERLAGFALDAAALPPVAAACFVVVLVGLAAGVSLAAVRFLEVGFFVMSDSLQHR
jgi:hypothetical protein